MKKFFLFIVAMLALTCCKDDTLPKSDEISISLESKDFNNEGGTVSVEVNSTGEWTLSTKDNATYDWVSTDKINGNDGDVIKFTVSPNETEEARFAYYVFTCGTATKEFKITSFAGEVKDPLISIEDKEIIKDYNEGTFEIIVKYSEGVDYRGIKAVIPSEVTWLKYVITLDGEERGIAKVQFKYDALEDINPREASFTINYDKVSIPVKMKQTPKPQIVPELLMYNIGSEAGTLSIKVSANVEYNVEVLTDGENWLTDYSHSEGVHSWKYSSSEDMRKATVKFTELSVAEGAEPIVVEVKVVQNALITIAARMNDLRAVLRSDVDRSKLNLGKNFTIEALIRADEGCFDVLNSIIGVDDIFFIGHSFDDNNYWEFEYLNTGSLNRKKGEVNGGSKLSAEKWTHIAITSVYDYYADIMSIKMYQDGTEVFSMSNQYLDEVDLSVMNDLGNGFTQEFAIGYSANQHNSFQGQMSEVRIWNKALTPEEINSENHFYKADTDSENLVAYWKMNDGKGSVIKDHSKNGFDLVVQKYNGSAWEEANLVWEPVSIPE